VFRLEKIGLSSRPVKGIFSLNRFDLIPKATAVNEGVLLAGLLVRPKSLEVEVRLLGLRDLKPKGGLVVPSPKKLIGGIGVGRVVVVRVWVLVVVAVPRS